MQNVRDKDTKPEMTVRKLVHGLGYRYRLHRKDLPGKPDLAFPSMQKVIFVHGCFWHNHGCKKGNPPKSNIEFWEPKLKANVARDRSVLEKLESLNWSVLIIWECELADLEAVRQKVIGFLGPRGKGAGCFDAGNELT